MPAVTPAPATRYRELRERLQADRKRAGQAAAKPEGTTAKEAVADALRRTERSYAGESGTALFGDAEDENADQHDAAGVMKAPSGKDAVKLAKTIGELKRGETTEAGRKSRVSMSLVKRIDSRTFYHYAGFWVDGEFTDKLERVHVKYLSDAYFKVLEKLPKLKDVFALGPRLIVVSSNAALIIDDGGKETIDDAELNKLIAK